MNTELPNHFHRGSTSLALVVSVGVLVCFSCAAPADEMYEETRGSFAISYAARRRVMLDRLFQHLDESRTALSAQLGANDPLPVTVVLCETPAEFDATVGYDAPWFVAGVALSDKRLVALEMDVAIDDLYHILDHELCHIYLRDAVKDGIMAIPRWMNEAIAKRLSKEWTESDDIVLRDAVLANNLLDFRSIERLFPAQHRKASIAYAQSATFLAFAEEQCGPYVLYSYLNGIRDGLPHETALTKATGMSLDELEEKWLAYLRKHYRKILLLYRTDELLFFIMAILVMVGFVGVVRRKRRWHKERAGEKDIAARSDTPEA